jgi:hypothetical protein
MPGHVAFVRDAVGRLADRGAASGDNRGVRIAAVARRFDRQIEAAPHDLLVDGNPGRITHATFDLKSDAPISAEFSQNCKVATRRESYRPSINIARKAGARSIVRRNAFVSVLERAFSE